ncbi:MAG: hypothetical protein A2857_02275 [Candidatus Levybacteria bacterium RIFCSPHIGHO2_01_FULL_36_15]|nr:MAG: hypothetical protein A2857_02275 [Candidatus Levybacteria bacterium RIFCSPHIGHO2_01_FULL_36_15]
MLKIYKFTVYLVVFILPLFVKQAFQNTVFPIFLSAIFISPVFYKSISIFINQFNEKMLKKRATTSFFMMFLVVSFFSSALSVDKLRSVSQLGLFIASFIVFEGVKYLFNNIEDKKKIAIILILSVLFLSVLSLYGTLVIHYVSFIDLSFYGLYFGHNHLSALLVFAIPLTGYFMFINKENRKFYPLFACFGIFFLALLNTYSRASVLALIISVYLTVIIFDLASKKKILLISAGVLFAIFVLDRNIISFSGDFEILKSQSSAIRIQYWNRAINNFLAHPVLGSGPNTFGFSSKIASTDSAHNFFLQMLSDVGIFGFLTSLGLIIAVFINAYRVTSRSLKSLNNRRKAEGYFFLALWIGILASALNNLVDFDWQIPTVFYIFWILAGLF